MNNLVTDFPPDRFVILALCDARDHRSDLDLSSLPQTMTIDAVRSRLRCHECGSRQVSIRIIRTAAGGFAYSAGAIA